MLRKMSNQIDVVQGLKTVLGKIEQACEKRPPEFQHSKPILVAVAKTKPVELIVEAYEAGQRHFGENYVQELEEKAQSPVILEKCKDIKWHFIGHLQSNKVNKVLAVPNIHFIETVDSVKLANILNKNWAKFGPPNSKLNIMVQVNTSGEQEKSGAPPSEIINLTKYVLNECPNLHFNGLMTIGKYGYDPNDGPNPDFLSLRKSRDEVCQSLELDFKNVDLSMGMSTDYEQAVELGSTYVRVGSSIFGERANKE